MKSNPFFKSPPKQPAKNYAAWLLGRKEYSVQQLKCKLLTRGYSPEQTQEALEFLQLHRFVDDVRFAQGFFASKSSKKGNRRISQELSRAGISPSLIEATLNEVCEESDRAWNACARFVGQPLDMALRQKVYRFLAYRGFSSSSINQALKRLEHPESFDE